MSVEVVDVPTEVLCREFRTKTIIGDAAIPAENKDEPATSFTTPIRNTGATKTLIANNLPPSIDRSAVISFFKQAGDIVDVRLAYFEDGNFRHSGHIEFATEEAAKKAVKFHYQMLLGHQVKLKLEGTGESKTLYGKNLPSYTDKSDVIKFFKEAGEIVDVRFSYDKDGAFSRSGLIEFSTEEAAKKAVNLNGQDLLGCRVELRRQAKENPGASKTVCVKNLSLDADESDVMDFFEEAGDIADVRFLYDEDGTFRGIGYVEFATEEAAKEAVKLNGQELVGCRVQLGIVRETLYVQGLDTSSEVDEIRNSLNKHFKTCGYIVFMDVETDDCTGAPLGTALVEFSTLEAFTGLLR
ncbi:hypothetical protein MKW94_017748 [Papaver nudicaule]|uniref:RRM domain-containing protein n=1 Tax=Papaver nudicaule TaxID=74823 RepID=A0AA41VFC8_PAPNU|nr:hypothetical protein [Papaver nudicaule]